MNAASYICPLLFAMARKGTETGKGARENEGPKVHYNEARIRKFQNPECLVVCAQYRYGMPWVIIL